MNLENIRMSKRKTILQFALPAIIAMVLTSLITVVDGFSSGTMWAMRDLPPLIWVCRLSICSLR